MSTIYNVCDLSRIYEPDGYSYSLPQKILESFFSGLSFGRKVAYTPEERQALEEDIQRIYAEALANGYTESDWVILTAGAPGSGKTTKQREVLLDLANQGKIYPYICPDDVFLKQLSTYKKDVDNGVSLKEAYDHSRPASNAGAHAALANLILEKIPFAFGTTSTSPDAWKLYKHLKDHGRQIRVIHLSAPDDVRVASIKKRDQTLVQTTNEDINEKGKLLPQRILDTFIAYADEIDFNFRSDVDSSAVLAARWTRIEGDSSNRGTLQIFSANDYEKIKTIHDTAVANLNRPDLFWANTVDQHSIVKE